MMSDEDFLQQLEIYRHDFFRFIQRNLWNPKDAEEIFCAAVAVAYENLKKYTEGTSFRAWMYKIIINKCFVANREIKRTAIDIDSLDDYFSIENDSSYEDVLDDPEKFIEQCGDEVVRALTSLSTMERSCFLLLALAKYSYKEIAGILEIPVGTVMTHLSRGRTRLRKSLLVYAQQNGIVPQKKTIREIHNEKR